MNVNDIKLRLEKKFNADFIEVLDINGAGNHFNIMVISNIFENMTLLKRHQLIYMLFKRELTKEIHALQIKTYTKSEWKLKNNTNI